MPDLRLHARLAAGEEPSDINSAAWESIARFADGLGLRLSFHERVPVELRRWIGVCRDPTGRGTFGDHCLVMSFDRIIFDPSISIPPLPMVGVSLYRFTASEIYYGSSFDPKEQQNARLPAPG